MVVLFITLPFISFCLGIGYEKYIAPNTTQTITIDKEPDISNPIAVPSPLPTDTDNDIDINKTCSTDSDCVVKMTSCPTSASCDTPKGCVNKSFTPPVCPKNSPTACSDVVLPASYYCFCQSNICVNENEKFSTLVSQDINMAIDFCTQYRFGMNSEDEKLDLCKSSVAGSLLNTNYAKSIELCNESNGLCGYRFAQKIAKMGYKEDALSMCHKVKYQASLCYKYIAFEIAKYDYNFSLPICNNISEEVYFNECITEVERVKPIKPY